MPASMSKKRSPALHLLMEGRDQRMGAPAALLPQGVASATSSRHTEARSGGARLILGRDIGGARLRLEDAHCPHGAFPQLVLVRPRTRRPTAKKVEQRRRGRGQRPEPNLAAFGFARHARRRPASAPRGEPGGDRRGRRRLGGRRGRAASTVRRRRPARRTDCRLSQDGPELHASFGNSPRTWIARRPVCICRQWGSHPNPNRPPRRGTVTAAANGGAAPRCPAARH